MPSKTKRRRDPLSPKPILDKKLLLEALRKRDVILKERQLDAFYQLLHRNHYPSLSDFVRIYYANKSSTNTPNQINETDNEKSIVLRPKRPLKNPVSSRNKLNCQLPKAFLDFLNDPTNDFSTITSTVASKHTSLDGTTTKLEVQLQDGHVIESVIMRHISKSSSRATLCVSSQVGY